MNVKVRTSQVVNGNPITSRQIEVLRAVRSEGSKNAAAKKLGISVPVVHRYISSMERSAGVKLIRSTPSGTELTPEGLLIVEIDAQMELRCIVDRRFTVSCSPVTEDLMMSVLSALKLDADLVISDDAHNLRAMKQGTSDIAILDDPMYLFDAEEFEWTEIGTMGMVHVDNGPSYIRYRYGAQRIAYMYLDSCGADYSVDMETFSLSELLGSSKSFFIDEFLLMRKGIRMKSAVDPKILKHTITAIYRRETKEVSKLLKALLAKHIQ
ncbi:MAG: LysR family transcriptional regulator [Thermoplasmatales archaeon]|nr:LysR family transcriptional regulator [Thermoplasmatales archaeon]